MVGGTLSCDEDASAGGAFGAAPSCDNECVYELVGGATNGSFGDMAVGTDAGLCGGGDFPLSVLATKSAVRLTTRLCMPSHWLPHRLRMVPGTGSYLVSRTRRPGDRLRISCTRGGSLRCEGILHR